MIFLSEIITEHSLWFVPLCILFGIGFAYLLYTASSKEKELTKFTRSLLFISRAVLISVLSFFLLNPLLKRMVTEKEKPIIIIAQDNSLSLISNKDSVYMKAKYLESLKNLGSELADKYEVKFLKFDARTEQGNQIDFKGKETDYSQLFKNISNNFSNRNIGALLLATDGLYNKGNSPVYDLEKFKFPIYTIALGDTTILRDALIKKIDHNDVAYLGNKFPLEVTVNAGKLAGKESRILISKGGKVLAEQKVSFVSDEYTKTYSFMLDADKPGVQKYLVSVATIEEEQNKANNTMPFVIEIIDNRDKILILSSAPHPDVEAIKESILDNQNYEVESALIYDFNSSLKPYSLVVLNQIQLSSPAGTRIINELSANNTSFFLLSAYGSDKIPGANVQATAMKYNDAEPVFVKSFSLFTLSDELKKFLNDLPAVKCVFGNYSIANSANVLLTQRIGVVETENPMLIFNSTEAQKSAIFLGDGIWRWKMRDFAEHEDHKLFNELITKLVQYLSVKADKSFFRVKSKKIINENEAVELEAEVYNNSYELITEPEVTMVLTNEEGKKFNYTFSKTELGYRLNLGLLPPGEYSYKALTNNGTKAFEKSGVFTVKEIVSEKINTVADHQLLKQISNKTSGQFFYPNQMDQITKKILADENVKIISYTQKEVKDLIDVKWIFALLMALLSLEWFVRKRHGLY